MTISAFGLPWRALNPELPWTVLSIIFGNRTFAGAKIDYRESLKKNWEIFKRKWSIPEEIAYGSSYDLTRVVKEGFVRKTLLAVLP